jgi:excisionase family DNA binding protein
MKPLLISIPECCRATAMGRSSIYKLIRQGRLPIRKIGRRTLIAVADLEEFVTQTGVHSCDTSGKATP